MLHNFSRDESLELLQEKLTEQQLSKVITQGYSDISLSVMASYNGYYARMLADSRYEPQTFNKLAQAFYHNRMPEDSFMMLMEHSQYTNRNEPYTDAFLDSLSTVYPSTAANCFAAVNYNDMSYAKAVSYVQSGAFYATDQASLSVINEVAAELYQLHIPLRGCEGFNHCYDVDDLQASLDGGDAVFVEDMDLAVTVHEMMKLPDWERFKNAVEDSTNLTDGNLRYQYWQFSMNEFNEQLSDKLHSEFDEYVAEMRTKSGAIVAESALQIVAKEGITECCAVTSPFLSKQQYEALLSRPNTLDEIYEHWRSNDFTFEDIPDAIKETADRIQISIDRKQQKQPEPISSKEPEQAVKPKLANKPRR